MKIQKILTKDRWGIVDTMIQIIVTFVNDSVLSVAVKVAKSIIPFPSMQARLLKTRMVKPTPIVSFRTKRQGPTFSHFDSPKLPDNSEMQRFMENSKGKESSHLALSLNLYPLKVVMQW